MITTPTGAIAHLSINAAANAAAHEITVIGTLPEGDTTSNVSYVILDTISNTVVGQVVLPNAVKRRMAVKLTIKVPTANASYAIGTFEENGFQASSFLSVSNPTTNQLPSAAVRGAR